MFDVIPFGGHQYNVVKLSTHLKCSFFDYKLREFMSLWSQAVHGNCFYDYPTNAWGATYGVTVYFDTETSAVSLVGGAA